MAYCIMEKDTKSVIHWEVFSLCNSNEIENCKDLVRKMDERPHVLEGVNIVLMERQPKCNPKMRAMASTLRSYLVVRGLVDKQLKFTLKDYSPKHKLSCWDGPIPKINAGNEYLRRKKLAIFQCEQLIKEQTPEVQEIYKESQKKKDDLADCFLQCLSYIMFDENKKGIVKIINKRRPTLRQMKYSKLSKPNIKYMIDDYLRRRDVSNHPKNILDQTDNNEQVEIPLDEAIELFFNDNPKVHKLVVKMYGTEMEQFRLELIPKGWETYKFSRVYISPKEKHEPKRKKDSKYGNKKNTKKYQPKSKTREEEYERNESGAE